MSQGMLGLLPLSAVRGPRATLDELLAGPDGPQVLEELKCFNKKQACWTPDGTAKEHKPRPRLDNRIEVDRSKRPIYPSWARDVLYPSFENIGPSKYRLNKVGLWLYPDQESGFVKGNVVHEHLRDNEMLKSCLGLADAIEIQKKGIEVFRKFFGGRVIHFWKSVIRHSDGNLRVPSLCEVGDEVVLSWYWLGLGWDNSEPAARFAS